MHKKPNSYEAKSFIDSKFEELLNSNDCEYVANNLGDFFKNLKPNISSLVFAGCIDNIIPDKDKKFYYDILSDPIKLQQTIELCSSYSNTMKTLSGSEFQKKVCIVLNSLFKKNCLSLKAVLKGEFKKLLNKLLKGKTESEYLKPDIDIVVYNESKVKEDSIECVISVKTTGRDRITQTLNTKKYINELGSELPVYYVTSGWDDDLNNENSVNRNRVQTLDGTFVTSENTKEYGTIKKLSSIVDVFKKRGWGC